MNPPLDQHGRPLRNLRISVTDRCNLRCSYCMPEESYAWFDRSEILTFEEIGRVVDVFQSLGVDKVRLTGGEPLLRRELPELVRQLVLKQLCDLALTTNGVRLQDQAAELQAAGLHRVTISLDTLKRDRFTRLTRRDSLSQVLAGIETARSVGFEHTKIDTVVMRGINDDELVDLLEYGRSMAIEVRFIEYMDVGGATQWSMSDVVTRPQMLEAITDHYGPVRAMPKTDSAPADQFELPDGTRFGIISSTTAPFCGSCDRSRLTADGQWFLCLYASAGTDLKSVLRSGASDDGLRDQIASIWHGRSDRGAEERLAVHDRGALMDRTGLVENPHLEMHKRGG